jgi:16S rRNA processing protein RimM
LNKRDPANQDKSPGAADDFVTIARVTKTQGRRGEVAATLLTDFPELFTSRKRLYALDARERRELELCDARQERRELELEDHWFHKGQVVLKFKGVDSIDDAETLVGSEIQVPRSERAALEDDTVYVSDLIGCTVFDSGRQIGRIEDVQFGAGEAPLLVIKGAKEYLVPFAGEYLEKVLLEQKRVEMKLPEGMLDLDAPLSADEKKQQKQPN